MRLLSLRWWFVCAAVLLPLAAQAQEKALEAVRDFKKHFRTFKEPSQRVEAIYTLKGNELAAAAEELVAILDDAEETLRDAALEVLSSYTDPATYTNLLAELPKMKNSTRRAGLIVALGRGKHVGSLGVLRQIALEDKAADPQVKAAIARAVAAMGDKSVQDLLAALALEKDALVRMSTADAIGQLQLRELGSVLIPMFKDPAWQVQSAAAQAAGKARCADTIEGLIELMRKGGRLREETADALFRITGSDFGMDPDLWLKQWRRWQDLNWRPPTDEELAKAAAARKKSDSFYGKKDQQNSFSGIATTSTKILFLIDQSGSMEEKVIEVEKFQGYDDLKKLTIAKSELIKTIDGLSAQTEFNVIAFATALKPFKKFLVPANVVTKAEAKDWVKRLQPIGGSESQELAAAGLGGSANLAAGKTNTHLALMSAFGMESDKERGPTTPNSGQSLTKSKLDTVFFLSDGRPSVGKLVDTTEILKEIKELNQVHKIVIHTIAIGEFQKEFMSTLATDNGGVFVDLGR